MDALVYSWFQLGPFPSFDLFHLVMEISLTVGATVKPEAVALDHLLPDDDDGMASPRAVSGSAKRLRRTASVVMEEMRMLSFMTWDKIHEPSFSARFFPAEEIYPVHIAAYFADVEFLIASRADPMQQTSMRRGPLEIAKEFNTFGSHDRFIAMLNQMQSSRTQQEESFVQEGL
eukprot:s113_g2.t1